MNSSSNNGEKIIIISVVAMAIALIVMAGSSLGLSTRKGSDTGLSLGGKIHNIQESFDAGIAVNGTEVIDSSGAYKGSIGTAFTTTTAVTFGKTVRVDGATTLGTLSVTSTSVFGATITAQIINATGTPTSPNTFTYASFTNATATNFLAATTLTWGVNAGTAVTSTYTGTTSTMSFPGRTCFNVRSSSGTLWSVTFDNGTWNSRVGNCGI